MKKIILSLAIVSLFINANSEAKDSIGLELKSYKKVITTNKEGKKLVKWVKPTKVVPGDIVKYVTTIQNSKKEVIPEATLTSKIDKNLVFIPKSVESKLKYDIEFSVDGKNFAPANKLEVISKDGKKHIARTEEYRAIKFKVYSIPAKSNSSISYQTKVK